MPTRAITSIAQLPEFDVTAHLSTDREVADYLTAVLADGDPTMLQVALGDIARARGMTDIAREAGITREALYKALRPGAQPRFDTVARVCAALGVRLVFQPRKRRAASGQTA